MSSSTVPVLGDNQRRTRNPPWNSNPGAGSAVQNLSQLRPQSTSVQMNAPTFYDVDNPPADPHTVDIYEQWIQANAQQQHGFDFNSSGPNADPYPYRPQHGHVQQPQRLQSHPPMQNQFTFVQGQYQPSSAQAQLAGQAATYPQLPAQQIPNNGSHFYPGAAQQAVQRTPPGYRFTPSYNPPQFGTSSVSPLNPTASAPSNSEFLAYLHPTSLSPMSDIPAQSYASGPSPPPPNTGGSSVGAPAPSTAKPAAGRGVKKGRKRRRPTEDSSSETDDDSQGDFNVITHPRGPDHPYSRL